MNQISIPSDTDLKLEQKLEFNKNEMQNKSVSETRKIGKIKDKNNFIDDIFEGSGGTGILQGLCTSSNIDQVGMMNSVL